MGHAYSYNRRNSRVSLGENIQKRPKVRELSHWLWEKLQVATVPRSARVNRQNVKREGTMFKHPCYFLRWLVPRCWNGTSGGGVGKRYFKLQDPAGAANWKTCLHRGASVYWSLAQSSSVDSAPVYFTSHGTAGRYERWILFWSERESFLINLPRLSLREKWKTWLCLGIWLCNRDKVCLFRAITWSGVEQ